VFFSEVWLRAPCDLVVHRRICGKTPTDLQLASAECRVFIIEQDDYKRWSTMLEATRLSKMNLM